MISGKILLLLICSSMCVLVYGAIKPPPPPPAKTKTCADLDCNEVLFSSTITRHMENSHEHFLQPRVGDTIEVLAFQFSDRIDILEGKLANGRRGMFYINTMDKAPYVEFLLRSIENKKRFNVMNRINDGNPPKQTFFKQIAAEQDLVRMYNVKAQELANENGLPPPQELPVPELPSAKGHGHSHGGHGHSHGGDGGHGHSHGGDGGHGHSHGADGGHGHSHEGDDHHGHSHAEPTTKTEAKQPQNVAPPTPVKQVAPTVDVPEVAAQKPQDSLVLTATPPPPPVPVVTPPPVAEQKVPPVHVAVPVKEEAIAAPEQKKEIVPPEVVTHEKTAETLPNIKETPVKVQDVPVQANEEPTPLANEGITVEDKLSLNDLEDEIEQMLLRDEMLLKQQKAAFAAGLNLDQIVRSNTIEEVPVPPVPAVPVPQEGNMLPQEPLHEPKIEKPIEEVKKVEETTLPPLPPVAIPELPKESPPLPPLSDLPPMDIPIVTTPAPLPTTQETPVVEIPDIIPTTTTPPVLSPDIDEYMPPIVPEQTVTEAPPLTTTTQEPIPADPLPTVVAENGYCDSKTEDCTKMGGADTAIPPPPVDAQPAADTFNEQKAAPFEDMAGSHFVDMEAMHNKPTEGSGFIGGCFASLAEFIRSTLGLGSISDAGVGLFLNVIFIVTAIFFHLIGKLLSDGGDSSLFDKRTCHTLSTTVIQLKETLKQKDEELRRANANGQANARSQADAEQLNELKMQIGPLHLEVNQLRSKLKEKEEALANETKEKDNIEKSRQRDREEAAAAEERARETRREQEESARQLVQTQQELHANKSALTRLENDLHAERRNVDELTTNLRKAKESIAEEKERNAELVENIQRLGEEKDEREALVRQLEVMLDEARLKENTSAAEQANDADSGGSVGWSDFGDEDEKEKEKTVVPTTTTGVPSRGDIREVAGLRATVSKLEDEKKQDKVTIEREIEQRRAAEKRVSSLESDLEKKTREVVEKDTDRRRADDRVNDLLEIVKGLRKELSDLGTARDLERDDATKWKNEYTLSTEERKQKEEKIKELTAEIRTLRNSFTKLETKLFSDTMELRNQLKAAQLAAATMQPMNLLGDEIVNNSSGGSVREGAPSRGPVQVLPSLWDQEPSRAANISRNRAITPHDLLSDTAPLMKGARSRRSDRMVAREPSPSDGEKRKEKKDGSHRRVRSRSHGRQPFNGMGMMGPPPFGYPDYGAGYGGYPGTMHHEHPAQSFGEPLHGRNSKSGQVYYSSGGSNGGRSPPPEMILLPAVPPPGVRKPAGKRATGSGADFKS